MIKGLRLKFGIIILGLLVMWVVPVVYLARFQPMWILPSVGVLAFITFIVLVVSFKRLVLRPLERMGDILKGMAAGEADLTLRVNVSSTDEIGEMARDLNTFLDRLRDIVARARESSIRVLGLTEGILGMAKEFMAGSQEQATATNDNFKALGRMDVSVQDVAGSAESLNITSTDSSATVTEMAAQVDVVAESAAELSSHVEEASSSITQMTNSIKEVAENVKALAELASQTAGGVNRIQTSVREVESRVKESAALSQEVSRDADTLGNEAIAKTIEAMERIRETVEESSGVIERLGARSMEIGQILKVIDEVTNQTSLLALNAAILAAQAGEHGKGFAVVANEIKDLAERTSASTGEIARLIKSVQGESQAAVESMRLGKERVVEGAQRAYGARDAFVKILASSNRSKDTSLVIEKATTEEVAAVREVAEAIMDIHERVRQIENATLEQSKGSELIARAADKINDVAHEVRKAMSEQSRGIRELARALEDTKEMAGAIAGATSSQSDESTRLVRSMEKFLEFTQGSSDTGAQMEGSLDELLRRAETLRNEMGRFKV
jgi:methyl-accepting chemotaxis protein